MAFLSEFNPVTSEVLDVNVFIKDNRIKEVTSHFLFQPGSDSLHPDGILSEIIFGEIMSDERYITPGYIDLKTDIITPLMFMVLTNLNSLYIKILSGVVYVVFDKTNNFVISTQDDPNAGTGYKYFIDHIYKLKIPVPNSKIKQGYKAAFDKYQRKRLLLINKLIVLPAGLREITEDQKMLDKSDVNSEYLSSLSISNSIAKELANDVIYNTIRLSLQKRVFSIFEYFLDMISGKPGLIKAKFSNRTIAYGTRNVASVDIKNGNSPDDPNNLCPNTLKASLFQTTHAFHPITMLVFKEFLSKYITPASTNAVVLKNYMPYYLPISNKIRDSFTIDEKIENIMANLKYKDFREQIITIDDHPIAFIYTKAKRIYISSNIEELSDYLKVKKITDNLRYLTYGELFYIICVNHVDGKTGFYTRYPCVEPGSVIPQLVKTASTQPSETKYLIDINTGEKTLLPAFPIIGNTWTESVIVNTLRLKGLNGDLDGDTGSFTGMWSDESNNEIKAYMNSLDNYVDNNGNLMLTEQAATIQVIKTLTY